MKTQTHASKTPRSATLATTFTACMVTYLAVADYVVVDIHGAQARGAHAIISAAAPTIREVVL